MVFRPASQLPAGLHLRQFELQRGQFVWRAFFPIQPAPCDTSVDSRLLGASHGSVTGKESRAQMIAAALALLCITQPAPDWTGQFTITTGSVVIERNGQQMAAGPRAGLLPGDRILTGPDGAAAVSLPGSLFVYLGRNTDVELTGNEGNALTLRSGELRVLVGGDANAAVTV